MDPIYEKIFSQLTAPAIPNDLAEGIIRRIEREKTLQRARRQLVIFCSGNVISLIAFIFAFSWVKSALIESGFWQFFSLIFSDIDMVLLYWQNYLLSLLETLPVANLILFLCSLLACTYFIKVIAKDVKILRTS